MEDHHLDIHSDDNKAVKGHENEFACILTYLSARERNALNSLSISTVDAFCKYDFTQLLSIRNYGETTVTRLQALQKRILAANQSDQQDLSLQSPIRNLWFSANEYTALQFLNIVTVGDFLNTDLSNVRLPKRLRVGTYRLLVKNQKRLIREFSVERLIRELSVSPTDSLNPCEKSAHEDDNIAEKRHGIDFSFTFIFNHLAERERNALNKLAITTVDAFCEYDFTHLLGIHGYGETTVTRLQALQKRILAANQSHQQDLSLQSPIRNLWFSANEYTALQFLNIATVGDFLNTDLSKVHQSKGCRGRTYQLLVKSQKRLKRRIRELSEERLIRNLSTSLTDSLNTREKNALVNLNISTCAEFARFDFRGVDNIPNIGAGTLQSLLSKQTKVRQAFFREKGSDSHSAFSYDDEFSVFILQLSPGVQDALWQFGITRMSELASANIAMLELACPLLHEVHDELCKIQRDITSAKNDNGSMMNDLLASTELKQLGVSDTASEFLCQNDVKSLQDFLFIPISKENFSLWQLQHEWRSRYAPVEFLREIPLSIDICFNLQKYNLLNTDKESYYNRFQTAKDFLSASFEDMVRLTDGDLKAVQQIQSSQYDMLKSCNSFCPASIARDDWSKEITEETLHTLPFFCGKPNRGFVADTFHESFLPKLGLYKIVRGQKLRQRFINIGITSLGELLLISYTHLLLGNLCTKDMIQGIQTRIRELLIPPPPTPLNKSTPEAFLISVLQSYVRHNRAIDILIQRLNGKTLKEIAEMYGLTRERIRQIESKCKSPVALLTARSSFAEVRRMLESSIIQLGGFAHVQQIASQLAVDHGWPEEDCTQFFVEFLLDRVADDFIKYGNGYYSTLSYPCVKCGLFAERIANINKHTNDKIMVRHQLFSHLLNTCCSDCIDLTQRITESFVNWKCSSDSLFRRIMGDTEIYHSPKHLMKKMVYHVLKDAEQPMNTDEILATIKNRTGHCHYTKKQVWTAASNVSISHNDIFLWDRGSIYVHRKNMPIDKPLFVLIEERLKQLMKKAKTPYISLYTLFSDFQSECEAEGIPSAHALHACLKARDIPGIAFMRSPYVSVTDEKHERKNVELLEKWVAEKQDIVSSQSLKRYAREIGINSHRYASTYVNLKSLLRYGTGLIVHVNSLDWNQSKQNSLLESARDYWKRCLAQGCLFARTDEFLSENEAALPVLANDIPWASDLIFSLLLRSESIVTFGNTYLAYGIRDEDFAPQTLGDIVVAVLKNKFDGGANLREISSYFCDELQILRRRLTSTMINNHPGLVITEHEIYLSGGNNAS